MHSWQLPVNAQSLLGSDCCVYWQTCGRTAFKSWFVSSQANADWCQFYVSTDGNVSWTAAAIQSIPPYLLYYMPESATLSQSWV